MDIDKIRGTSYGDLSIAMVELINDAEIPYKDVLLALALTVSATLLCGIRDNKQDDVARWIEKMFEGENIRLRDHDKRKRI